MRDLLLAPDARYRDMLSGAFVEGLVARHLAGAAEPRSAAVVDHVLRGVAAPAARMDAPCAARPAASRSRLPVRRHA